MTGTIAIVTAASLAAYGIASGGDEPTRWMLVAHDSSYAISIDTSRIVAAPGRVYEVWYRTDHAATRFYNQKAFTREVVHAVLSLLDATWSTGEIWGIGR